MTFVPGMFTAAKITEAGTIIGSEGNNGSVQIIPAIFTSIKTKSLIKRGLSVRRRTYHGWI